MNFISKIRSVGSNPAMFSAYARWVGSKLFSGAPPRLSLPGGTSVGGWLSFSEYWSFQNAISKPEQLFVERCLGGKCRGSKTAIDVGANVGTFTCLAASTGCIVHAFEPIPETFCRLKNNVKFNGLMDQAQLNCLAVGTEQGLVTFQVKENSPATNRMATAADLARSTGMGTQTVAAVSLDTYCAAKGIQEIAFLKIDVEGMEPYVLRGAAEIFAQRKVAAVLIEICPGNLRSVGLSPADLHAEFNAIHYSPYRLDEAGRPGPKLSLADIEAMVLANIILLPDS